jgi:hypothetical protein
LHLQHWENNVLYESWKASGWETVAGSKLAWCCSRMRVGKATTWVGNKTSTSERQEPFLQTTCRRQSTLLTLSLIERLVKAFKTHLATIDLDVGFANGFSRCSSA